MWKNEKKAAGYREVNAWLSPDALAALDAIRPVVGKVPVGDLIGAALVSAAGSGWRYGADVDNQVVPGAALADLRPALDDLLARVAGIEAQAQAVTPAVETVPPAKASTTPPKRPVNAPETVPPAKTRTVIDNTAIAAAVAEKRAKDGDRFNRAALHRELQAAGVAVHKNPANFATAVGGMLAQDGVKA